MGLLCLVLILSMDENECCLNTTHDVKDGGGGLDEADGDSEDKLMCLFDQAVSVCLNEAIDKGCIRPLPVLHGDGQALDLFKLFWLVSRRGGFDLVKGYWKCAAKELGLDAVASASLKLVYFKYLYQLERWLRQSGKNRSGNGKYPSEESLGFLSYELERHFKNLVLSGYTLNGKDDRLASLKNEKNGKHIDNGIKRSKVPLLDTNDVHGVSNGVGNRCTDDDENFVDLGTLNLGSSEKESHSRKRKRESLARMLNWLIQVAKCPDDPLVGKIPPQSKWKDHSSNELWIQAIKARNALLQRRRIISCTVQNNQRMHPSIYEDTNLLSDQSVERARCGKRLPAWVKSHLCSGCSSCSVTQSKVMTPSKLELGKTHKKDELLSATDTSFSLSADEEFRRYVAVGPRFQAVVPEWTGTVSVCDPKWLGTRVWPLESGDHNASGTLDPLGKGRTVCDCQLPGSVTCIRFHIAERRMKLKLEIGSVFYHWRFDHMGEEVSLRWTEDEEKTFKDMVRLNPPSLDKSFWDDAYKYFPTKTRKELVSYYFNVFLVRRRSYQNRVTPNNIDSDDDESDFGSLSDGFGLEAIKVPGANILICSENMQSSDFR